MTDAHAAFRRGSVWLADLEDDVFLKSRRAALWILEPAIAGLAAHLPDARREPRGGDLFWIGNSGAESIDLVDFEEDVLITLDPGFMVLVSLIAKETAAGVWITMVDALNQVTDPPIDEWVYVVGGARHAGNTGSEFVRTFDPQLQVLTVHPTASTENNIWEEGGSCVIGGGAHIIATGGSTSAPYHHERVNTNPISWSILNPTEIPRGHTALGAYGGLVWSFGGGLGGSTEWGKRVYRYDPTTDSHTRMSDMVLLGTGSQAHTITLWEDVFIRIGGTLSGGGSVASSHVLEHDPVLDAWSTRLSIQTGVRRNHGAAHMGDRITVWLGQTSSSPTTFIRDVDHYDPALDAWSIGVELPIAYSGRSGAATTSAHLGGTLRGYIIGGSGGTGTELEIFEYALGAPDSWTQVGALTEVRTNCARQCVTMPPTS